MRVPEKHPLESRKPIVTASRVLRTLLWVILSGSLGGASTPPRPNIILIMADDLGYSDLGCYGSEIRTPNLDHLARNGLRFSQFYNNAICPASRASLLSGLYSQQVGSSRFLGCVTLAEGLRAAGYRTLMSGKWHLDGHPLKRGFERYYGLLTGTCNHFNPGRRRPGEPEPGKKFPDDDQPFSVDGKVIRPYTPEDRRFYSTDAFTDRAIRYLEQYGREDRPFFLYLAYTVPHYPLHAWPEDIVRYRGRFMAGWDALRRERHRRLVREGLISEQSELSVRSSHSPAWDEVADKQAWDLKMAVYAAMVDRMDQNIGRLLETVRALGKESNTLVLFLSDNGASDEDRTRTPDLPPGPVESYRSVDLPWANLSNTPFRQFKRWNHEGGIATPLVAYWPRGIAQPGRVSSEVGHLIDIMATCLEVAGADYPSEVNGMKIPPLEGRSLLPIFRGKTRAGHETLFWNQRGLWRAVRQGRWKLVSPDHWIRYEPWRQAGSDKTVPPTPGDREELWQLYDMDSDRTEERDLSSRYPDRVKAMGRLYKAWNQRVSEDWESALEGEVRVEK